MKIIRNIEVSRMYGVSPTAVTNWIEASKKGRNQLQLKDVDGKYQILDTAHNRLIMEQLSESGRVFKRKDQKKEVTPNDAFYEIFSKKDISNLILSLEKHREIPHKFTYINGGAKHWKNYVSRSFEEKIKNTVTNTNDMMKFCYDFIISKASKNTKFNIIDIGVGDASPVKNFLTKLFKQNLIHNYIAIDFSPEMLDIAEDNIRTWFGDEFPFKKQCLDVSNDSIQEILFYNSRSKQEQNVINLVLFLGSTIENQLDMDRALLNLKCNLANKDYFFLGQTLDTDKAITYFDIYSDKTPVKQKLPNQNKWIPELMGINEEYYEMEMYFDEKIKTRKMDLIFNLDVTVHFNTNFLSTSVEFLKGDRVTVWRHSHHSLKEISDTLAKLNLFVEFSVVSDDKAQILTISRPVD